MARSFGRIYCRIWTDEDFKLLEPGPQRLYVLLLSQPTINYAGVLPLQVRRWATTATNTTVGDVRGWLDDLAKRAYVVVDENTEEVLVRSFIRNDELWRTPNMLTAALRDASGAASTAVRRALRVELERLPLDELSGKRAEEMRAAVLRVAATLPVTLGPTHSEALNPTLNPTLNASPHRLDPTLPQDAQSTNRVAPVGLEPTPAEPIAEPIGQPPVVVAVVDEAVPLVTTQVTSAIRDDVERLCAHLADRVEANGSKRPTITKGWRDAARLMLDRDHLTEDQVHKAIDWSQDDEFWRANILSMPTLRQQFDRLRQQARRNRPAQDRRPEWLQR